MELIEITEDNADDFADIIDADIMCNLGRSFFYGLGVTDDEGEPRGALVYELLDYDSDDDTRSRIHTLIAEDEDTAKVLMSGYDEAVSGKDVTCSFYEIEDERIDGYLTSFGFESQRGESPNIVLTVEELGRLSDMIAGKNLPPYIKSLSEVSLMQYRSFLKSCLIKGRFGLLEDLGYLPMTWFDREVSSCAIADEKVDGVLLVRCLPSNTLEPCLFTAFGLDYQKNLGILMMSCVKKTLENYSDDTRIVIRRHSANVKKLTDKFFPDKSGDEVYIGMRAEG